MSFSTLPQDSLKFSLFPVEAADQLMPVLPPPMNGVLFQYTVIDVFHQDAYPGGIGDRIAEKGILRGVQQMDTQVKMRYLAVQDGDASMAVVIDTLPPVLFPVRVWPPQSKVTSDALTTTQSPATVRSWFRVTFCPAVDSFVEQSRRNYRFHPPAFLRTIQ